MDGFGVSQALGRAAEFRALSATPRKKGLDYLFSTTTGAGLSMIRNRIGSGGYGDSILPSSPGSPNGTRQYVWDGDDRGQVWFSKEAQQYGVTAVYSDAWSAPGFMKTNGDESNGGYPCSTTEHTCSSGDWRQAYANMLAQYIKYYQQEGIQVTHLGFLNEPDYTTSYSSMNSNAQEAASFIPTLYNTLRSNNLGDIMIACCDSTGWPNTKAMASGLISMSMESYLGVFTSHAYSGNPNSILSTRLKVWQTEAADLKSAWCTTWYSNGGPCECMTWAGKIATGILNANLSVYMYWEGVEVNQQQASSYLVLSDGTNVYPSGRLWAIAMWSRFIRPGAYRVSTSGSGSGVAIGAFKNVDNSVIVVLTNSGSSYQSVRLDFNGFTPSTAKAYLTDSSHQVASTSVTLSGGAATVSVPGRAVVTVSLTSDDQSSTTTTQSIATPSSTTPSTTTSVAGPAQARWGQCGGIGWTGPTTCQSPWTSTNLNPWHYQCL